MEDDVDKRFIILESLGEGTYGQVFKAIDKKTNVVSIIFDSDELFSNDNMLY